MPAYEASVIIPVFNQWEFTRKCLAALDESTRGERLQVIVIDNASSDETEAQCPALGQTLFGDSFVYRRNGRNRNFGPASNQGASLAAGEYLIFLNNDTEPLPGWYRPLLDDFAKYPGIGATGPLLLYPHSWPFGYTVQHLGVFVSPLLQVGHLHEHIAADSPLARKRRFFQVITGACMVMRKSLFMDAGMFYPGYVNGCEDVDLCARLSARGLAMTVNPESRVLHHAGRSAGRHAREVENSALLARRALDLLRPDWPDLLAADGLDLALDDWLELQPALRDADIGRLCRFAESCGADELLALLVRYPYWQAGWKRLISIFGDVWERGILRNIFFRLHHDPAIAVEGFSEALAAGETDLARGWLDPLSSYCKGYAEYLTEARSAARCLEWLGFACFARQYERWLDRSDDFRTGMLEPLCRECARLSGLPGLGLHQAESAREGS